MKFFRNMYINLAQQASAFNHNVRNEVVSATIGTNEYTYSYDPIGNRTASTQNSEAKSYISNPLNQYIAIQQEEQTVAPIYDADGNMMSSPSGWSFTWNAENRLISASRGGVVVSYTYDAFGRMISKQIIGAENKTITYTWDVFNIIKETENSIATYNIWGLDVDGTMQGAGGVGGLIAVAKSGSFYTPTYDANGNITEYIDEGGNVVAQYQYSAFGEIISQSGESFTHRFSTKPYCTTTGLVEYQFRKYDPVLGRWLSRDPIEEAGGINLYAFCENSIGSVYELLGLAGLNLEQTEKKFYEMVAKARKWGYDVAADNLEHFLGGTGEKRTINWEWLRDFTAVIKAEKRNRKRIENVIKDKAKNLVDGEKIIIYDYFDATETASIYTELYYASGSFTITSSGEFVLFRKGCDVFISGNLDHRWWDIYDWHNGLFTFIPSVGFVEDSEALSLEKNGKGKSFIMESWWTQSLSGIFKIRSCWWDTASFNWSEPRSGKTK